MVWIVEEVGRESVRRWLEWRKGEEESGEEESGRFCRLRWDVGVKGETLEEKRQVRYRVMEVRGITEGRGNI